MKDTKPQTEEKPDRRALADQVNQRERVGSPWLPSPRPGPPGPITTLRALRRCWAEPDPAAQAACPNLNSRETRKFLTWRVKKPPATWWNPGPLPCCTPRKVVAQSAYLFTVLTRCCVCSMCSQKYCFCIHSKFFWTIHRPETPKQCKKLMIRTKHSIVWFLLFSVVSLDYRCGDGRFLVSSSCVTYSNPISLSSNETGDNPGIRSWKLQLSDWAQYQKAIGGVYFTKKLRPETLQPGLEFDNFKPRL
jgi:hypothetical protein